MFGTDGAIMYTLFETKLLEALRNRGVVKQVICGDSLVPMLAFQNPFGIE